jgi:hypothetical protein
MCPVIVELEKHHTRRFRTVFFYSQIPTLGAYPHSWRVTNSWRVPPPLESCQLLERTPTLGELPTLGAYPHSWRVELDVSAVNACRIATNAYHA